MIPIYAANLIWFLLLFSLWFCCWFFSLPIVYISF
jgi:hypothetical protein